VSVDPKRVQVVFRVAVEETNPTARAAMFARECKDHAELPHRVDALLETNDQPDSYLDRLAVAPVNGTIDYAPIAEQPGTRIGPYPLREQIGEGGFGLVFVAEQTEPGRHGGGRLCDTLFHPRDRLVEVGRAIRSLRGYHDPPLWECSSPQKPRFRRVKVAQSTPKAVLGAQFLRSASVGARRKRTFWGCVHPYFGLQDT
jgi:hypothetical protein